MSGKLENNGHDVRLKLDEPFLPTQHYVNISAGPLSYQYRVSEIILHYGVTNVTGSEHTINGVSFPAEVSKYCHTVLRQGSPAHIAIRYDALQRDRT